jgi:hypothetical protein
MFQEKKNQPWEVCQVSFLLDTKELTLVSYYPSGTFSEIA